MDIMSMQFLSALFAIVVIDLVLAGDNAIVIALAARALPPKLQKRAIVWGALGAIVVRTTLTLVVVALLKIPGLLFAGGLLLVWIAYKLLIPEEGEAGHGGASAATSFWGALRTIIVADTVMGLDNVLAVAGAAHGSFLLVAIGLLISIPIVIWGSTLLLRFVERYPAIVYVGSGVLAWTSVKMMSAEPLVAEYVAGHTLAVAVAYIAVIGGVLAAGFVHNHRTLESRISARLARFPREEAAASAQSIATQKEEVPMLKILVPVDGSRNALHAVRHVIAEYHRHPGFEVHLLNVQAPFSRHVAQFVARRDRDAHRKAQAESVLAPLREMLESASVPFAQHVRIGKRADTIADEAKRLKCDHIVLATARKNSLTRMIESSVTNRVLDLTSVPVEVVVGDSVSRLERYGIPLGLGAGLGTLMILAFD
jgi:YjbE family integral membrane protein